MVNRKWLMVNLGLLFAVLLGIVACRPAPSFPARNVVESSLPVQLKWQAQVDEQVDRLPVISEEVIAVATDTALYGFDKESGARLWRHEFRKYQPSPVDLAANDNIVVYGDKNGLTEALRLSSGEVLWRHYPCYSGSRHSSSIVVANEVVYAAYSPTAIEAREIESGDRIWQQCSPTDVPSRGAKLFLDGDDLYVITSAVHILNAENGEITWSTKLNIAGDDDQLENGRFYGGDWVRTTKSPGVVIELEPPTYKPIYGNCTSYNPPYTFHDDQFFGVGSCGGVFSMDQDTNDIQWSYNIEADGVSPMSIYNGILYVLFENGEIHALEPFTGDSLGILRTDFSVVNFADSSSGIVADDELIVVVFDDNNVWAFE